MTASELKAMYEQKTGQLWNDDQGILWLMQNYEQLEIYTRHETTRMTAFVTLSDKGNWLAQQPCRICNSDCPINIAPVRIKPESWQSLDCIDKAAFKDAVRGRFLASNHFKPYEGAVCLTILFVCSAQRNARDLDNMAKLLMDSIKDVIMGDDKHVDHLNLVRLKHEGEEEFVTLRIANSKLNNHDDAVLPKLRHSWEGMELLKIENFRSCN